MEGDDEQICLDAVHQYAYCARRAYLMYHEGQWESNFYTEEGRSVHRRVDAGTEKAGKDDGEQGDESPKVSRSVSLGSEALGLSARLDVVEAEAGEAVPVEFKRGKPPDNQEQCWPPERVQLMAQGLLLREAGFRVSGGLLYFRGSRQRVHVEFTADLEAQTMDAIRATHQLLEGDEAPAPLVDSPKCNGCSMSGICLPDETNVMRQKPLHETLDERENVSVRRLFPPQDIALPFYVQEQGARIGKDGEGLTVRKGNEVLTRVRLLDISQVVLCGGVQLSSAAVHLLSEREVPVIHLSRGHWFYALTRGMGLRNAFARAAQFAVADDAEKRLVYSRAFVKAKTSNQRTMLRRNGRAVTAVLARMKARIASIDAAEEHELLLGIEGAVAADYFKAFGTMLRSERLGTELQWKSRNKRPPRDPINAMLSFGYALLAKDCAVALLAAGLDPFWGFFHRPRHGRPALALDLMEEFRPILVDSAVIKAVNTGMIDRADFQFGMGACALNAKGRRTFIQAYESRLDQTTTHPVFGYKLSWRRVIQLQAQLLLRAIRGESSGYRGICTR